MKFISAVLAASIALTAMSASLPVPADSVDFSSKDDVLDFFKQFTPVDNAAIVSNDPIPDTEILADLDTSGRQLGGCSVNRLRFAGLTGPFRAFPSAICLEDYPGGFRFRVRGRAQTVRVFTSFGNTFSSSLPHTFTVFIFGGGFLNPGLYYFYAQGTCGTPVFMSLTVERCTPVLSAAP